MGSLETEQMPPPPPDLSKPKWSQDNYVGRAMHFFKLTNPLNLLASDAELDEAKNIVDTFKKSKSMPPGFNEDKLWDKKYLVDSAFHPDTGEKVLLIGRMAAQMPMNTIITGAMITFYRTTAQTVFCQWINQTFNAIVNYSNRSGSATISKEHLFKSYVAAVGGAVGTALFLNSKAKILSEEAKKGELYTEISAKGIAKKMSNPIFARLVPFAAVCAANFINVPMMRSLELTNGTPVFSPTGDPIGVSKNAAMTGIILVCFSRCMMAIPGMTLVPVLMNYTVKAGWFCKTPQLMNPFQLLAVGLCIGIATPLGCALFPQKAPYPAASLEPELQKICNGKKVDTVYYNKGL